MSKGKKGAVLNKKTQDLDYVIHGCSLKFHVDEQSSDSKKNKFTIIVLESADPVILI